MLIELVEFLSLKIRKRGIKIDRRIPDGYLLKLVFFESVHGHQWFLHLQETFSHSCGKKCYRESPINDYSG